MRLGTFNVENLFTRPAAMNHETWEEGRDALKDFARLGELIAKPSYAPKDKAEILEILERNKAAQPPVCTVQEVRERLVRVKDGEQVVADGRGAWTGWIDLVRADVDHRATSMTGRVIREVAADVLCTVEVENRITLDRFNDLVLRGEYEAAYPFNMCVDGNDERGIDVGLLSRFPILSMRSHIYDEDEKGTIFSRDCAEYEVQLPTGDTLWVLANHLKSKGYGSPASSNAKRKRQATRVAEIYREAVLRSPFVAVVGDLNDTPASAPLAPPFEETGLRDISTHELWQGSTGTYRTGNGKTSKLDYVLLSPALWDRVQGVLAAAVPNQA